MNNEFTNGVNEILSKYPKLQNMTRKELIETMILKKCNSFAIDVLFSTLSFLTTTEKERLTKAFNKICK